jgi:hypothetical protein
MQLMHDLAVWYHLAWIGETVRRSDALIAALSGQASGLHARTAPRSCWR